MDAIKWIEQDLNRSKKRSNGVLFLFMAVLFLVPMMVGIGFRSDLNGVFDPRVFIPNGVGALCVAFAFVLAYASYFTHRKSIRFGAILLIVGSILMIERVFFPEGLRTHYGSQAVFWDENLKCFLAGGVVSLGIGIFLTSVAFLTSSLPSRSLRFYLSLISGASGMVMLGFHCDSSSVGHIFFSHVAQGMVLGACIFLLQEFLFSLQLKKAFPELTQKIKNVARLG
jgi:hypothetical protein